MDTTFTVDTETYTLKPLSVRDARHLSLALAKVLGPGFATAAAGESADGISAVVRVVESMDDATLDRAVEVFSKNCTVTVDNGKNTARLDLCLDKHFQGRIMHHYRWLAACVQSEFGDFFAAWGIGGPAQ